MIAEKRKLFFSPFGRRNSSALFADMPQNYAIYLLKHKLYQQMLLKLQVLCKA